MLLLGSQNSYDSTRIDRSASVRVVVPRADSLVSASRLGFAPHTFTLRFLPTLSRPSIAQSPQPTLRLDVVSTRADPVAPQPLGYPILLQRTTVIRSLPVLHNMRRTTAIWLFRGPTEVAGGITCFLLASLALVSSASLPSLRSPPSLTSSP